MDVLPLMMQVNFNKVTLRCYQEKDKIEYMYELDG